MGSEKNQKRGGGGGISLGTSMMALAVGMVVSFGVGCKFRGTLMTTLSSDESENACHVESPLVIEDDISMETSYTSKQFHVKGLKESVNVMVKRIPSNDEDDDDDEEEESKTTKVDPSAGQHLLVDLKNVSPVFLDSAACLVNALISATSEPGFPPLLSHHCHSLFPSGVSCVGVSFKGHFSFHTWPEEGVITLDVYTSPAMPIHHIVPVLKREFGVKNNDERFVELSKSQGQCSRSTTGQESSCPSLDEHSGLDPPRAIWKLKLRGFRTKLARERPEEEDINDDIFDNYFMDYVEPVITTKSIFQQIDVVDVINPKKSSIRQYERSISTADPTTYEAQHPELFLPQRIVFLDGVTQSNRRGDEPYHETLVQPALFAHAHPRRAAIIGGGEGATLREVLRHDTIQHVTMVEIDQVMVETSRKYLPGWSDCSDLVDSSENCFDEPRAEVLYEDAVAWFKDRTFYEPGSKVNKDRPLEVEQFDVVIVDALDPQDINNAFSDVIYSDPKFLTSLFASLTPDGIMVMQLGPAPDPVDPDEHLTNNKNRPKVFDLMQFLGFETVQVYEEVHCGFEDPWTFIIGCKSIKCRDNWYASEANVQLAMHERLKPTKSGRPPLQFFDGATMSRYHGQTRAWETVFCRDTTANHVECDLLAGFGSIEMVKSKDFEVTDEGTLVSKVPIEAGNLLLVDEQVDNVRISTCTMDIVEEMNEKFGFAEPVAAFAEEYGIETRYTSNEVYASSGKWNFAERNDSEKVNTGNLYLDRGETNEVLDGIVNVRKFNPVISRRFRQAIGTFQARRSISAGEPISF